MNEKTKLRVIQILCIVSLLITVFSIQRTYARYYEQIGTNYSTQIRRWTIYLNGEDIHLDSYQLSQEMQPVFVADDNMNSNNTLVPGRKGYFEFEINYEDVQVPFRFQFDIEQLNTVTVVDGETSTEVDNHLTDFQIYGYSIVEGEGESETETTTELSEPNKLSELTQYINPNDVNDTGKTRKIRILFRWYDGTDNQMDNSADTTYVGETNTAEGADELHTVLNYNITVTFTQTFEE